MFLSKRVIFTPKLVVFFTGLVLSLPRLLDGEHINAVSLTMVDHLALQSSCPLTEAQLQWRGGAIVGQTVYFRGVAASAGAPGSEFPAAEAWKRDPDLFSWFKARTLIRQRRFAESLPYLKLTKAGHSLLAAGHKTYGVDPACTLFSWALAHEIGGLGPDPDPGLQGVVNYGQVLVRNGQAEAVIAAYERLLLYKPGQLDWRLTLAQSYLAQNRLVDAETVLAPVLNSSTDQRMAAERLLDRYRAQHP